MNILYKLLAKKELEAYNYFRSGKKIPLKFYFPFFIKGFLSLFESLIRNISGPFGFMIRRLYYSLVFKKLGKDVLIDTGVIFSGAHNISCGNKVWFDCYSVINCPISDIEIGNFVHIHTHTYLGGKEKIIIGDYCGISSGSRLFTGSINILTNKKDLMMNPMMELKNDDDAISGPIIMEKNALILSNCVVSPNLTMKEGSVLLSGSFLTKSTEEFTIYMGLPAKKISNRF